MKLKQICLLCFSPTGGTRRVGRYVAKELSAHLGLEIKEFDFTRPQNREREYRFDPDQLLVMASPVYAGRLPNKMRPEYQAKIHGQGGPAVPVCVFGNRSFDEALRELVLLLEGNGFQVAGAAAFAGRHPFSNQVGQGRPDEADFAQMRDFAAGVAQKLAGEQLTPLSLDRGEIGPYYNPLKADGTPAKFLKAKPKTDWDKCDKCGACYRACPVECIDENMDATGSVCIKCQACVRCCHSGAKYFDDPDFLSHVLMLEQNYIRRAQNAQWL
ncbi:MAG TPA: 4Fe-4S binding protein [Firmicutes bacterium]|nr:4Fe-4S binding protein [Bacillota bacterium]